MTPIMMEETASEMATKATSTLLTISTILVTALIRVPTVSENTITLSSSPCARMAAL